MKNTLTLIGAIAVAIGVLVAAAIIIKKQATKKAAKKAAEAEENELLDIEDLDWEEVPVEDEAECADELAALDAE